jgi:ATP-dependent DNA helicase RecG
MIRLSGFIVRRAIKKWNIQRFMSANHKSFSMKADNSLSSSLESIKGIGPKLSQAFKQLDIHSIGDVLLHYPTSMIDRRNVKVSLADVEVGTVNTLKVTVHKVKDGGFNGSPHKVYCTDENGVTLGITLFLGKGFQVSKYWSSLKNMYYTCDNTIIVSGRVSISSYDGAFEMANPDRIFNINDLDISKKLDIETIYPQTQGLTSTKIATVVKEAIDIVSADLAHDYLDGSMNKKNQLPTLLESLKNIHSPQSSDDISPLAKYRQRIAFDELVASHLKFLESKAVNAPHNSVKDFSVKSSGELTASLIKNLPFSLTKSQKITVDEIFADMESSSRMSRLIQGDVGSGKTIVAFLAMLKAVEAGKQACLIAPTEILAKQHFSSLCKYLDTIKDASNEYCTKKLGRNRSIISHLITGSVVGKTRDNIISQFKSHDADIAIGTHALLTENVLDSLSNLEIVVVDEEQKFGVNQRELIASKTNVIYTTATPIPRSMMLAALSERNISTLTEKPPAKRPIKTVLLGRSLTEDIIERIKVNIPFGTKIFWVTPSLNPSKVMPGCSAIERNAQLSKLFPGKVGLLHGKMSPEEKNNVMFKFSSGEYSLLVSTTVVEVGVDVPDASICVIDRAEYFGLSQLHQIRGRIGRGERPPQEVLNECYCVLLYDDLKQGISDIAEVDDEDSDEIFNEPCDVEKLKILEQSNDGFEIAEADLKIRGPGDLFGIIQHGHKNYKVTDLKFHSHLVEDAILVAKEIFEGRSLSPYNKKFKFLMELFSTSERVEPVKLKDTKVANLITTIEKKTPVKSIGSADYTIYSYHHTVDMIYDAPTYIIFDLEATGLMTDRDRIIQLAAVVMGKSTQHFFNAYVLPDKVKVPPIVTEKTKIEQSFLESEGLSIDSVLKDFVDWIKTIKKAESKKVVLIAHNGKNYDFKLLHNEMQRLDANNVKEFMSTVDTFLDSVTLLRTKSVWTNYGAPPAHKLETLYNHVTKKDLKDAHNALFDCMALESVLLEEKINLNWKMIAKSTQFAYKL